MHTFTGSSVHRKLLQLAFLDVSVVVNWSTINMPFSSCLLPLYQNRSTYETVHNGSAFDAFSYETFCTKTRFETEAKAK